MKKQKLINHILSNRDKYYINYQSSTAGYYDDIINVILEKSKLEKYNQFDEEISRILDIKVKNYIGIVIKYNKSTNDIITIFCCSTNPFINNLNKPIFEPEEFERLILTFNL